MAITLATRFSRSNYYELDLRWQIVSKLATIAGLLPLINNNCTIEKTLNPRAPLKFLDHRFGFHEVTLQIPDDIETVEICSIMLSSQYYVCGIGFRSKTTYSFHGNKTQLLYKSSFPVAEMDTISFAVDGLGIRSIQWGVSQGVPKAPGSIGYWEGFSLKQRRQEIRIVSDALKFRYIGWSQDYLPSFSETLLMRGGHASLSGRGTISEEHYMQQNPRQETDLVTEFGNFAVEALWFEQGLQSISTYSIGGLSHISGVSITILSGTYYIGYCDSEPQTMALDAPSEILTEIDIYTSRVQSLAMVFKTSYGRQSESPQPGSYLTVRNLQPPPEHYITGLYFQIEGTWIESVGLIYAACPSEIRAN
ncbi:uncharacterized protein BDV17DRAFT_116734 [Aspergillus undulatus]|uniref:uncharacterized protein n=1 Tax=Aspergillus undulatus TaxID=1810928 RepID=UPI003CCDC680